MEKLIADLCVVGGGLPGVCCAITAARAGAKVVLVQDRPVLGGNASSEVRLWILGATSHMGSNNRWAREGGVVDEILVENLHRNPEGDPLIVDTILLEKVVEAPNITLLLNTAAFEVEKTHPDRIERVRAFCSLNSTMYDVAAPLFCDASGDGIVGFLSGAAFRMGAEAAGEFNELLAPEKSYGELLGDSIYFYSKDAGRPVRFIPPSFALSDITRIPKYKSFNARTSGCHLWWIEYGGRLDTVHAAEQIKWELWRIVYGVWNHIKNSGQFPEAANLTLEWVGHIPGKRESRRFEGPYLLTQSDVLEQRRHEDDVAHGGWSIDLHPADGVYSPAASSNHWHAKGIFPIPYRCLYSRNIVNLFLAGRVQSSTHVAFGATRVMATGAYCAQAAGLAAAICARERLLPDDLSRGQDLRRLQLGLQRRGQHIPGLRRTDPADLAQSATLTASSELVLDELPNDGPAAALDRDRAQLLPLLGGPMPTVTLFLDADQPTALEAQLRISSRPDNYVPDVTLARLSLPLKAGENQAVTLNFPAPPIEGPRYAFICLLANSHVRVRCSQRRMTGVLTVRHTRDQADQPKQGVYAMEFWPPERRPNGHNFALRCQPPIRGPFAPAQAINGWGRPTSSPNAWVADPNDPRPSLTLSWPTSQTIAQIDLCFDTDFDHALESVIWDHPEAEIPFCVRHYRILDAAGNTLAEVRDNHQTQNRLRLDKPIQTDRLSIEVLSSWGKVPASIFEVRCYANETDVPA